MCIRDRSLGRDGTIAREQQRDIDLTALERSDCDRTTSVERFELAEVQTVRGLQADHAERSFGTLGRTAEDEFACDGLKVTDLGEYVFCGSFLCDSKSVRFNGRRVVQDRHASIGKPSFELLYDRIDVSAGFACASIEELEHGAGVLGIQVDLAGFECRFDHVAGTEFEPALYLISVGFEGLCVDLAQNLLFGEVGGTNLDSVSTRSTCCCYKSEHHEERPEDASAANYPHGYFLPKCCEYGR